MIELASTCSLHHASSVFDGSFFRTGRLPELDPFRRPPLPKSPCPLHRQWPVCTSYDFSVHETHGFLALRSCRSI